MIIVEKFSFLSRLAFIHTTNKRKKNEWMNEWEREDEMNIDLLDYEKQK